LIGANVSETGSRCGLWTLDHANAEQCLDAPPARAVEPGSLPQIMGYHDRINLVGLPPCGLIAVPVECAVMASAERHGEFIADPAAEGARLCKPQVMSIRGPPPADQARLRRHKPEMRTVAVATRFVQRECAFVDMPGDRIVDPRGQLARATF
jgi:hypothetical protein